MPSNINDKLVSWASDIDPGTVAQAEKTARLPIVEGHVALMPDAHVGLGATVGSVIPTKGAVIPAAVGVDIGCGMVATELTSPRISYPTRSRMSATGTRCWPSSKARVSTLWSTRRVGLPA
jgi:tRNA-splicing ligase RtcB